ncbi:MAG: DUF2849 domain-containing protein [Alphaproteobacteria bacterium]|jgi:sulfite reductase (NADPH) hemoprotein beta-component|nr:DUF2849 domain-containing protein [Alphaproteobacteria bacterium]|tara:strand:- start:264 stop:590 length:327 start_codon:yes stop_codon:yes gene_type:complete
MSISVSTNAPQAITANRLSDGFVVYLTARNSWSKDIADCLSADDPEAAKSLLARAQGHAEGGQIVGPYLFKIARQDGHPVPLGRREILRTTGPSVGTDLNQRQNHVPL